MNNIVWDEMDAGVWTANQIDVQDERLPVFAEVHLLAENTYTWSVLAMDDADRGAILLLDGPAFSLDAAKYAASLVLTALCVR